MSCNYNSCRKKASYDGSTMIKFVQKIHKMVTFALNSSRLSPLKNSPVITNRFCLVFEIDLPDKPMRYTSVPNALDNEGIWGEVESTKSM